MWIGQGIRLTNFTLALFTGARWLRYRIAGSFKENPGMHERTSATAARPGLSAGLSAGGSDPLSCPGSSMATPPPSRRRRSMRSRVASFGS
jgi:hypothetical protein